MFLILFVIACLTQMPQDTEVPCTETVFYQGSTAFCQGDTLDIILHLNPDLEINDVRFFDGKSWRQIPFTYYDNLYDTNLYHFSYIYESEIDYTCSDFEVIKFLAYPTYDGSYDFTLNVNMPNKIEE